MKAPQTAAAGAGYCAAVRRERAVIRRAGGACRAAQHRGRDRCSSSCSRCALDIARSGAWRPLSCLTGLTYGFGLWWFFLSLCLAAADGPRAAVQARHWGIGHSWSLFSGVRPAVRVALRGSSCSLSAAGAICSPPGSPASRLTCSHCIGNFVLCIALFKPLHAVLRRLTA